MKADTSVGFIWLGMRGGVIATKGRGWQEEEEEEAQTPQAKWIEEQEESVKRGMRKK